MINFELVLRIGDYIYVIDSENEKYKKYTNEAFLDGSIIMKTLKYESTFDQIGKVQRQGILSKWAIMSDPDVEKLKQKMRLIALVLLNKEPFSNISDWELTINDDKTSYIRINDRKPAITVSQKIKKFILTTETSFEISNIHGIKETFQKHTIDQNEQRGEFIYQKDKIDLTFNINNIRSCIDDIAKKINYLAQ